VSAETGARPEPEQRPQRRRSWGQRDRIVPKTRRLTVSSRLLFTIDHYTSLPWAALVVGVVLVGAVVVGVLLGFRPGWLTAFEVGTSIVTLMMLFVIQHTQGREQAATQRKLDELLRALPEAQSELMMLEEASDDEMREVEQDQRESKELDQRESKESAAGPSDSPA
jgi:low affinity Fe/Cu permease